MPTLLELSSLEKYIYYSSTPDCPWVIRTKLDFDGCLQRKALKQALAVALQQHPILSSKITLRSGRPHWRLDQPRDIAIEEYDEFDSIPMVGDIDLQTEPGLRLFLCSDEARSSLSFNAHHTCCDGWGLVQFVWDLLWAYDQICRGIPYAPKAVDQNYLLARRKLKGSAAETLKTALRQAPGIAAVATSFLRAPQPFPEGHEGSQKDDNTPEQQRYIIRALDKDLTKKIHTTAKQQGLTANDVLTRDILSSIAEWKEANFDIDQESWNRVMVPFSLRSRSDYKQQAVNKFGVVFIERQHKALLRRERLLVRLKEDFTLIKKLELYYTFPLIIRLLEKIPGRLKALANSNLFAATTVFSNVGRIFSRYPLKKVGDGHQIGDVTLRDIKSIPVIDKSQNVGFLTYEYGGQLHISITYKPDHIRNEQCEELLDTLVSSIRTSAET